MINPQKQLKFLVLTCTLAIFASPAIATTQTSSPAIIEKISGQGRVRIQREKRYSWTPARQATELYIGDQILPDKGTKVYIRCNKASEPVLVKAGVPSGLGSICPMWRITEGKRNIRSISSNSFFPEDALVGGLDNSVPYIITPRNSTVLSSTPIIRWNQVSGAKKYTIEVIGSEGLMWKNTTEETEIIYAGKVLQSGQQYTITIQTDISKSSQEDVGFDGKKQTKGTSFTILETSEADRLKEKIEQVTSSCLSIEVCPFIFINFYNDYFEKTYSNINNDITFDQRYKHHINFNSEAINILESLLKKGERTPLIYRLLGDFYLRSGLIRLAESNYLTTIELSRTKEDLEDKTLAYETLGEIYLKLDNPQKALEYYEQAKSGYVELGDLKIKKVIQEKIAQIKQKE